MKTARQFGAPTVAFAALLTAVLTAPAQPANQTAQATAKLVVLAPPILTRVAQATTVVVGKVEAIEEKTVSAKRTPNDMDKGEFQIAVIKIEDPILVAKGLTHVRVGFLPAPMPANTGIRPVGGARPATFAKDQEVLVFLTPHFDGNFLFAAQSYDSIDKQNNANFEKEVAEAKKYAKLLTSPKESLKAEKQEERYAAAVVLLQHYRTKRINVAEPKTEAVDGDISKLILTALAEADWNTVPAEFARLRPQMMFNLLGATDKDGWTPPMTEVNGQKQVDFAKQPEAMKQWCKDNADKFKLQRFVYEKAEKSDK